MNKIAQLTIADYLMIDFQLALAALNKRRAEKGLAKLKQKDITEIFVSEFIAEPDKYLETLNVSHS